MLLISLSNVVFVDLEVCCPIFGIFHFAPRYFNIIDRSKLSVDRVPNCCFLKRGQSLLQFFSLIISVFCYCNKVGSLKRISVLLTSLSNVGVVDLEVCCSILGTFHSAPRFFNFIDRNPEPGTLNPERGSCNKVGSLKRISVLLTPLSIVGVVDLEVCCSILGTFHSAPRYFNFIDRSELSVGRVPHSMMLEMLEIFWNGYHLLLQPLTDNVNNLWIDTAGNPSGIDISRALLMLRNWRQLWLRKKDSWLMVGNVVTIGREMDGWSDLGCGD